MLATAPEVTQVDVTVEALAPIEPPTAENTAVEALLTSDAKFEAAQAKFTESENKVVELAISTLDPKDMLKKYAALGKEALKLTSLGKASLHAGSWKGKEDVKRICDKLELLIRTKVAIKTVEMDKYIRIHLWVEAVKPLVPNVEKLSYYQVHNKFLSTLEFDPVDLKGEIKNGWIGFVTQTVARQLGETPYSMKELDEAIAGRIVEINAERNSKRKPLTAEEEAAAADKLAERKARAERNKGQSAISIAIDEALNNGHADPKDVAEIADKVLKTFHLELPMRQVGFDAENCTRNDVIMLAKQMYDAKKFSEMRILRDTLDQMLKIVDNSLITTKAG